MKNKTRLRKTKKECPYCSFFKPCGDCEAKRQNDPNYNIDASVAYEKWIKKLNNEKKHYKLFKGVELNPDSLEYLFKKGKTPIEALNDLSTAS